MENSKQRRAIDLSVHLKRAICFALSTIMALSIMLSVSVAIASALLRNESFVQKHFESYNSALLDEVNEAIKEAANNTGLPVKAYTEAIQEGHIQTALHQVSNNIVKGFKTDYTESDYLYGYYHSAIKNYCKDNGIPITEDELVKASCFAVDIFNNAVGDESTSNIILFQQTYTRNPMYAIIASLIAFVACFIILEFITFGKHKKYDYLGTGLITVGLSLIVLPLFAVFKKYSSSFKFMDVDIYNMALADVLNDILKVFAFAGVVILVVGITIMVVNYSYYYRKTRNIKTEHDIRKKLLDEKRAENELLFAENEARALEEAMKQNEKEINEQ